MNARAAVLAVFALNGALLGSWAVRVPAIKSRLELSDGELALALAAIAAGAVVAMPLAGGWAARVGSRRATRVAAIAFVLATPLVGFAGSLALLVLAAAALGASNGSLDVSMNAHGVAVERDAGRPLLAGFHAAFSVGGLTGAGAGALLAEAGLDVRVHLTAAALCAGAVLLAAWPGLGAAESRHPERGPVVARPSGALWGLGAVAFCTLMAEGVAADWSAVYVRDDLGSSPGVAGAAYAAFSATMAIGRIVGDRLVTALGPDLVVRGGTLLAAAGLGAGLAVAEPWAALAGFALMGAGLSGVVPVVFRAAGTLPGHASATAIAAVSTLGYAGFLAGPPLVGILAETVSLGAGLAAVAGLIALVSLGARRLEPRTA